MACGQQPDRQPSSTSRVRKLVGDMLLLPGNSNVASDQVVRQRGRVRKVGPIGAVRPDVVYVAGVEGDRPGADGCGDWWQWRRR